MTSVIEEKTTGLITQVIGPVVDVEFPGGKLPQIYDALIIKNAYPGQQNPDLVTEVQQLLGENRVRSVLMH